MFDSGLRHRADQTRALSDESAPVLSSGDLTLSAIDSNYKLANVNVVVGFAWLSLRVIPDTTRASMPSKIAPEMRSKLDFLVRRAFPCSQWFRYWVSSKNMFVYYHSKRSIRQIVIHSLAGPPHRAVPAKTAVHCIEWRADGRQLRSLWLGTQWIYLLLCCCVSEAIKRLQVMHHWTNKWRRLCRPSLLFNACPGNYKSDRISHFMPFIAKVDRLFGQILMNNDCGR